MTLIVLWHDTFCDAMEKCLVLNCGIEQRDGGVVVKLRRAGGSTMQSRTSWGFILRKLLFYVGVK